MDHRTMMEKLNMSVSDLTLPEGLCPMAWGQNRNNWVFFFENPNAEGLLAALEQVRLFVNAQYRLPRPLRFVAPYIAVVAVLDEPDPAVDAAVAESRSSGAWGGEIYHLVAVTRRTGSIVLLEPRGTRNQRYVESMRLRTRQPENYGAAVLRAMGAPGS